MWKVLITEFIWGHSLILMIICKSRVELDDHRTLWAMLCYLRFKGCTRSRKISKGMKEYVKNNEECRRKLLLKPFCSSLQSNDTKHSCCDIGAKSCRCVCTCSLELCICQDSCSLSDYQSPVEAYIKSLNDTEERVPDSAISNEMSRRRQTH